MTPFRFGLALALVVGFGLDVVVPFEGGEDADAAPRSPFEAVRWDGKVPEVSVGGVWHRLLEIDGTEAEDIVAFSEATYGDRFRKRFEEDIEELLRRMGKPPGDTVALALLAEGALERTELAAVAMSALNRSAIREEARRRKRSEVGPDSFPKLSPFSAVRWRGRIPEVQVGGAFYELLSIDGSRAEEIVSFCETTYGTIARKRFEEDLVEVLARMGRPPWRSAALSLLPLDGGPPIELPEVEMTEANRQAIWAAAMGGLPRVGGAGARDDDDDDEKEYPKLAPFTGVRWAGGVPEVEVDGAYRTLVSIDGIDATEIVRYCESEFRDLARKRFSEDLVEVLTRMGRPPGESVALGLSPVGGGTGAETRRVAMTAANRSRVLRANRAAESGAVAPPPKSAAPPRVAREHALRVAPEFAELGTRIEAGTGSRRLSEEDAAADLDQLEWVLENRYSYLALATVDFRAAFDAVRASLGRGISLESFAIQVRRLLALLGDGHTRLEESPDASLPRGYLPFLVADAGGRLVAFKPDRGGFLDPAHPYLASLDGVPAAEWIETAGRFVPRLSPVFHRQQSIRFLRELRFLRRVRGKAEEDPVEVVVEAEDGKSRKSLTFALDSRRPTYGDWPRTATRRLDGNIGYLRIAQMADDAAFLAGIESAMADFRGTRGLVIDVRGNGGGSREALRTLFSYFLTEKDRAKPRVANVSKYRLTPDDEPGRADGYLDDRFLWPVGAAVWSDVERAAIKAFAASFRPEWSPEAGFSEWHYFVLSPRPGGSGADSAVYYYDKPVAVLLDGGCFSATDVFLGAFKGWRNVTLVGTRSGGGSGRARGAVLERSGLRLTVSSMASFRPDGKLYDRNGVEPDVEVEPVATDLVGQTDTVLAAALQALTKKK